MFDEGKFVVREKRGLQRDLALATYKLRRKLEIQFYRVPSSLHAWDEEQAIHVTDWADLFFDLVVVAILFQIGNVLAAELPKNPGRAMVFSIILFLFLMENWGSKVFLRSIFNLGDIYHKFLDLFEGLVTGFLAVHIVSVEKLVSSQENEDTYNYLLAISVIKTVFTMITVSIWIEVHLWSKEDLARMMANRYVREIVLFASPIFASILTSALRIDWRITVSLWYLHTLMIRGTLIFKAFSGISGKHNSLPIHIEYVTHRRAEATMLCLGEGVLQISVTALTEDNVLEHLITYGFAFSILAMLMLTHYQIMPAEPEDTAPRKSRKRGVLYLQFSDSHNFCFFCIGVALKDFLKTLERKDSFKFESFEWLLSIGLIGAFNMMALTKLMHVGPNEIIQNTPREFLLSRLIYWLLRTIVPLAFLLFPFLELNRSWEVMAVASCLSFVLLLINIVDLRNADDARPAEFDVELAKTSPEDLDRDVRRLSRKYGDDVEGLTALCGDLSQAVRTQTSTVFPSQDF